MIGNDRVMSGVDTGVDTACCSSGKNGGTIYCTLDFLESYGKEQGKTREQVREMFKGNWNEEIGMYVMGPLWGKGSRKK